MVLMKFMHFRRNASCDPTRSINYGFGFIAESDVIPLDLQASFTREFQGIHNMKAFALPRV